MLPVQQVARVAEGQRPLFAHRSLPSGGLHRHLLLIYFIVRHFLLLGFESGLKFAARCVLGNGKSTSALPICQDF